MRYTSAARFLGLPLVDIAIGDATAPGGVARGWVAVGDVAVGYLVAIGGVASGALAIGGLAFGLIPIGGLVLGGFAVGGGAIGIWSAGGAAIAWQAALGGLAVATQFALGGAAFAVHANDAAATAYFSGLPFAAVQGALRYSRWLFLLTLLPAVLAWRRKGMSRT